MSAVILYLRLRESASSIGVSGENFWINMDTDHEGVEENGRMLLEGKASHIYVSFPSAKSGEVRFHTAEIIALVNAIRPSLSGRTCQQGTGALPTLR